MKFRSRQVRFGMFGGLLFSLGMLAACDRGAHAPRAGRADPKIASIPSSSTARSRQNAPARVRCEADASFPARIDVPEASGAAEVELKPGVREMLVVADSGHNGAALLWKIPSGPFRSLTLPVDKIASDDIEGLAWRRGYLYTLTSSGAVRRFSPDGQGALRLDGGAYPIGPSPYVCSSLKDGNCGKNYEGLCLRAAGSMERCAGYAASKKEGALYCVVFDGDRLALDSVKPKLKLDLEAQALSDCAFGAAGGPAESTLLVTTNIHGGSTSYIVDESTGELAPIDLPGTPTNEAIAVDRDGALYQFMDDNFDVSLGTKAVCHGF